MPELPEVETIRRDLQATILNEKIVKFSVKTKSQFKGKDNIEDYLIGKSFEEIDRIGKLLIFKVSKSEKYILCHLRMTGQLIHKHKQKISDRKGYSATNTNTQHPNKHTHIEIKFGNGDALFFNDIRKFGYMQLVTFEELKAVKGKFGIEPLTKNFTPENFYKITKNRTINVKSFLLNQNLIAGVGNIYADEICFLSGLKPDTKMDKINKNRLDLIFKSCQEVIAKAIQERGTSFSDYRDGKGEKGNYLKFLHVYGRQGKECLKCGTVIQKTKVGGRGTHYCPKCQK